VILLIDNYDSFAHNLARYFRRLGQSVQVVRNDSVDARQVRRIQPRAVVISPGPCTPEVAGCSLELVREFRDELPILGVCLGHQVIAAALGGRVVRAPTPMHGRLSRIVHDGQGVFAGLPNPLEVGRYHSLAVDEPSLPAILEVTARTEDGVVMALRHRERPVVGLQFHPESILTELGYELLAGFLRLAGLNVPALRPSLDDERPRPPAPQPPAPTLPVTF